VRLGARRDACDGGLPRVESAAAASATVVRDAATASATPWRRRARADGVGKLGDGVAERDRGAP